MIRAAIISLVVALVASSAIAEARPVTRQDLFDPLSASLSGRVSNVIRAENRAAHRIYALHYHRGVDVLVVVGQAEFDGGANSQSLANSREIAPMLEEYMSQRNVGQYGATYEAAGGTAFAQAVQVIDTAWEERPWCGPFAKSFNHNRTAEFRAEMLAGAVYLTKRDLWVFYGWCPEQWLLS